MNAKLARRIVFCLVLLFAVLASTSGPVRGSTQMRYQDVEYFFYHTQSDMKNDVNLTGYRICPCVQGECAYGGLILDEYRRVVYTDCDIYSVYGCLYHYNGETWDVIECF